MILTRSPFLNRAEEFDPSGWFMLVPYGEFPITRRKADDTIETYLQVIDASAVASIVDDFEKRKAASPGYRLLIDFDHFSYQTTKSSEAAGWVTDMEVRTDGVWAKGEWSDAGEAAIRNRRYRYLSPVWHPRNTQQLGNNRFRPIAVNDAGLTNKPNLGDALLPFWNRADDDFNNSGTPAANNQTEKSTMETPITENNTSLRALLIALLALPDDASDEQITTSVKALKGKPEAAAEAEAKAAEKIAEAEEEFKNRLTALEKQNKSLMAERVKDALAANADVIPEGQKAAWKNRLEQDFEGTSELLTGIKRPEGTHQPLHSRAAGAAAAARKTPIEGEQPFMNRVSEQQKANPAISHSEAILAAARAYPAEYDGYISGMTSRN